MYMVWVLWVNLNLVRDLVGIVEVKFDFIVFDDGVDVGLQCLVKVEELFEFFFIDFEEVVLFDYDCILCMMYVVIRVMICMNWWQSG